MRIRFLKSSNYEGNKTVIVNDIPILEACRFFVEYGQSVIVQNYILVETGVSIILEDGCNIIVPFDVIEPSEPSLFVPSGTCCNK